MCCIQIIADERIARSHHPPGRLGTPRETSLRGHSTGHSADRRRCDAIYARMHHGTPGENAGIRAADRVDKKQLGGIRFRVFGEVFIESCRSFGTRFNAVGRR